jgi:hypothetical protein
VISAGNIVVLVAGPVGLSSRPFVHTSHSSSLQQPEYQDLLNTCVPPRRHYYPTFVHVSSPQLPTSHAQHTLHPDRPSRTDLRGSTGRHWHARLGDAHLRRTLRSGPGLVRKFRDTSAVGSTADGAIGSGLTWLEVPTGSAIFDLFCPPNRLQEDVI